MYAASTGSLQHRQPRAAGPHMLRLGGLAEPAPVEPRPASAGMDVLFSTWPEESWIKQGKRFHRAIPLLIQLRARCWLPGPQDALSRAEQLPAWAFLSPRHRPLQVPLFSCVSLWSSSLFRSL